MCVVVACSTAVSDPAGARKFGNASIGVSIAGIVVSVIVVIIVVAVVASAADDYHDYYDCNYYGTCYRHKDYVGSYGYCSGIRSSSGYCYYD